MFLVKFASAVRICVVVKQISHESWLVLKLKLFVQICIDWCSVTHCERPFRYRTVLQRGRLEIAYNLIDSQ